MDLCGWNEEKTTKLREQFAVTSLTFYFLEKHNKTAGTKPQS
jgi:hypothetical protein